MDSNPLCITCSSPANVFITLVKAGQLVSQSYCKEHATSLGLLSPTSYALLQELEPPDSTLPPGVLRCPHCGFTQFDFNHQGRFGCSECYKVFKQQLAPILKQIQVSSQHVGKTPYLSKNRHILESRLKRLRQELQEEINVQHFEEAAHTRDEISELIQKLGLKE